MYGAGGISALEFDEEGPTRSESCHPGAPWQGAAHPAAELPADSYGQAAPSTNSQLRRLPGPAGRPAQGGGGSGGGPFSTVEGRNDPDFSSQPWLTALSYLDLQEFDERHPLLQHNVRTANDLSKSGKLPCLLALVVALQRTHSGQAFIRLKDPTGCIGGTICKEALLAEPGIQPGSALMLDKVTVLRLPSLRPLHHLCITLENISQVIPAAQQASQPLPSQQPLRPANRQVVPMLPAPDLPKPPSSAVAPAAAAGAARQWGQPGPGAHASPAFSGSQAGSFAGAAQPPRMQGGWDRSGGTPSSQPIGQQPRHPQGGQQHGRGQPLAAQPGLLPGQQPAVQWGNMGVPQHSRDMLPPPPRPTGSMAGLKPADSARCDPSHPSTSQQQQQQQFSQQRQAPPPQQPQQQQRGRGADWLQGFLQELPASDGFGCSQAAVGASGQGEEQAQDSRAKRARPDAGKPAMEAVFGDGIDELMAGLEDELGSF